MISQPTTSAELYDLLKEVYDKRLPFNRLLGLEVMAVDGPRPAIRFNQRPELIGNFVHKILHGGVISAVLDTVGGLTATAGAIARYQGPPEAFVQRITRVGTIDLRVDYLRPGRGQWFEASGTIMRTGRKVAVVRMELINDEETLIAVGTGTYLVG